MNPRTGNIINYFGYYDGDDTTNPFAFIDDTLQENINLAAENNDYDNLKETLKTDFFQENKAPLEEKIDKIASAIFLAIKFPKIQETFLCEKIDTNIINPIKQSNPRSPPPLSEIYRKFFTSTAYDKDAQSFVNIQTKLIQAAEKSSDNTARPISVAPAPTIDDKKAEAKGKVTVNILQKDINEIKDSMSAHVKKAPQEAEASLSEIKLAIDAAVKKWHEPTPGAGNKDRILRALKEHIASLQQLEQQSQNLNSLDTLLDTLKDPIRETKTADKEPDDTFEATFPPEGQSFTAPDFDFVPDWPLQDNEEPKASLVLEQTFKTDPLKNAIINLRAETKESKVSISKILKKASDKQINEKTDPEEIIKILHEATTDAINDAKAQAPTSAAARIKKPSRLDPLSSPNYHRIGTPFSSRLQPSPAPPDKENIKKDITDASFNLLIAINNKNKEQGKLSPDTNTLITLNKNIQTHFEALQKISLENPEVKPQADEELIKNYNALFSSWNEKDINHGSPNIEGMGLRIAAISNALSAPITEIKKAERLKEFELLQLEIEDMNVHLENYSRLSEAENVQELKDKLVELNTLLAAAKDRLATEVKPLDSDFPTDFNQFSLKSLEEIKKQIITNSNAIVISQDSSFENSEALQNLVTETNALIQRFHSNIATLDSNDPQNKQKLTTLETEITNAIQQSSGYVREHIKWYPMEQKDRPSLNPAPPNDTNTILTSITQEVAAIIALQDDNEAWSDREQIKSRIQDLLVKVAEMKSSPNPIDFSNIEAKLSHLNDLAGDIDVINPAAAAPDSQSILPVYGRISAGGNSPKLTDDEDEDTNPVPPSPSPEPVPTPTPGANTTPGNEITNLIELAMHYYKQSMIAAHSEESANKEDYIKSFKAVCETLEQKLNSSEDPANESKRLLEQSSRSSNSSESEPDSDPYHKYTQLDARQELKDQDFSLENRMWKINEISTNTIPPEEKIISFGEPFIYQKDRVNDELIKNYLTSTSTAPSDTKSPPPQYTSSISEDQSRVTKLNLGSGKVALVEGYENNKLTQRAYIDQNLKREDLQETAAKIIIDFFALQKKEADAKSASTPQNPDAKTTPPSVPRFDTGFKPRELAALITYCKFMGHKFEIGDEQKKRNRYAWCINRSYFKMG